MSSDKEVVEEDYPRVKEAFVDVYERILESKTNANILILVLVILAGVLMLGLGVITTRAISPIGGIEIVS